MTFSQILVSSQELYRSSPKNKILNDKLKSLHGWQIPSELKILDKMLQFFHLKAFVVDKKFSFIEKSLRNKHLSKVPNRTKSTGLHEVTFIVKKKICRLFSILCINYQIYKKKQFSEIQHKLQQDRETMWRVLKKI